MYGERINSLLKLLCSSKVVPSWLSPVERLAVNQSVKGPNPFDGAIPFTSFNAFFFFFYLAKPACGLFLV